MAEMLTSLVVISVLSPAACRLHTLHHDIQAWRACPVCTSLCEQHQSALRYDTLKNNDIQYNCWYHWENVNNVEGWLVQGGTPFIGQSRTRVLIHIRVKGGHFLFGVGADTLSAALYLHYFKWTLCCGLCNVLRIFYGNFRPPFCFITWVFLFLCISLTVSSAFCFCCEHFFVFWINCFYVTFRTGQVFERIPLSIRWRWRAAHESDEHDDRPLRQRLFFIINMCTWFMFSMFSKNP